MFGDSTKVLLSFYGAERSGENEKPSEQHRHKDRRELDAYVTKKNISSYSSWFSGTKKKIESVKFGNKEICETSKRR
jgi:hypothetical protein